MKFSLKELQSSIQKGTNDAALQYTKHLLLAFYESDIHSEESMFVDATMSQIARILKDANESPIYKNKTLNVLRHILIINGEIIYKSFIQKNIYAILRASARYNSKAPVSERGIDFYKNNKYFLEGNANEKKAIKDLGCKYIIFCLEMVYTMAKWMLSDEGQMEDGMDEEIKKLFISTYQQLKKQGVTFPHQSQFIFFGVAQIEYIEDQLKDFTEEHGFSKVSQMKRGSQLSEGGQIYSKVKKGQSIVNRSSLQEKELKEKQKSIAEMKAKHEAQLNILIGRLDTQRSAAEKKYAAYQNAIKSLNNQNNEMKTKIEGLEAILRSKQKQEEITSKNSTDRQSQVIKLLKTQMRDLQEKNKQFKNKISQLQSQNAIKYEQKAVASQKSKENSPFVVSQESYLSGQQRKKLQKLSKANHQFIRELLSDCDQPVQYASRNTLQSKQKGKSTKHDDFYQYKDTRECFQPFFSNLTFETQLRLRKCLLKSKEILFRNKSVQIGVITTLHNQSDITLLFILTNISDSSITDLEIEFSGKEQVLINKSSKISGISQKNGSVLREKDQHRQQLKIAINNIDFRCILAKVNYSFNSSSKQSQKLALILPISKIKLMQPITYTPFPSTYELVQRVVPFDRRLLSSFQKFKEYFPKCIQSPTKLSICEYSMKVMFLSKVFFVQLQQMQGQIRIGVGFQSRDRCLADKLLGDFIFILSGTD